MNLAPTAGRFGLGEARWLVVARRVHARSFRGGRGVLKGSSTCSSISPVVRSPAASELGAGFIATDVLEGLELDLGDAFFGDVLPSAT